MGGVAVGGGELEHGVEALGVEDGGVRVGCGPGEEAGGGGVVGGEVRVDKEGGDGVGVGEVEAG